MPEDSRDFYDALLVTSSVVSDIGMADSKGVAGPLPIGMLVNVPGGEISIGLLTPADLRDACCRLGIETTDLYGDVRSPSASGTLHRDGWRVLVYGPAGLTVIR